MSKSILAVAFTEKLKTDIAAKIEEAQELHPILQPGSAGTGIAEGREAFVADGFRDATANPKTVPGTIDLEEWKLLEEQAEGLAATAAVVESYLSLIQSTLLQVNDARYDQLLTYYRYLDGNLDKLPGAEPIHEKIAKLFEKQGNRGKKADITP